ncbi:LOW QUALITY PROTEIN: neutrophil cytosol factor 1 [Menidia menidia]
MEEVSVRHVELLGVEKRFFPSQHYVYLLMVKWSDQSEKLVYRTYPEIHTFHKALKEMFPIEAGQIEKKDRIIPSLPAPRWVDTQKSRESQKITLSEYCRALLLLPPHISRCAHLSAFLRVRPEDENPPAPNTLRREETFVESRDLARGTASEISGPVLLDSYRVVADFQKSSKHELSLRGGELVEIVEKNPNGWWFCQSEARRGWAPASYLEPLDGPDEAEEPPPDYQGEVHVSVHGYRAEQPDELSLEPGETVEVIHKLLDGWWVVRKGEETGHFPSTFLQKAGSREGGGAADPGGQRPPPRRSTIRNAQSIHSRSRRRLSQEAYRRNSRRYLQQKGPPRRESPPPLRERTNQENLPELSGSDGEQRKAPAVPPRPSAELILQRCTDQTRQRVSVHGPPPAATNG